MIPIHIQTMLEGNEYVYLTGNYTRNNVYRTNLSNTFQCNINSSGAIYSILTSQYYNSIDPLKPAVNWLWEQYTITSKSNDTTYSGTVMFNGFYENASLSGITTPGIQIFNTSSSGGIFSNNYKVIIDFNNPERQMYFTKLL